jgi:hypothetical protein
MFSSLINYLRILWYVHKIISLLLPGRCLPSCLKKKPSVKRTCHSPQNKNPISFFKRWGLLDNPFFALPLLRLSFNAPRILLFPVPPQSLFFLPNLPIPTFSRTDAAQAADPAQFCDLLFYPTSGYFKRFRQVGDGHSRIF